MRFLSRVLIVSAILIFLTTVNLFARIVNVPTPGFIFTIQEGIDAAFDGDTVLVQPGFYLENVYFDGKEIVVGSLILTTGNSAYIDSTIIDGDSLDAAVAFNNEEGEGAVLRGFTIQNGIQNFGGGIDVQSNASPVLEDLVVQDNVARMIGAGIYVTWNSTPTITRCVIKNNIAQDGAGLGLAHISHPVITNCEIIDNTASDLGGGIYIGHSRAECTIDGVIISGNTAGTGGAIYMENSTNCFFRNTTIVANEADTAGAIFITSYILNRVTQAEFVNSIIWGNGIAQCILESDHDDTGVTLDLSYSLVEGGPDSVYAIGDSVFFSWDETCLDADPLFSEEEGDYSLTALSPCIDAGDPELSDDPDSTRSDIGYYWFEHLGAMHGAVVRASDDEPIDGAIITTSHNQRAVTDSMGYWIISPVRGTGFDATAAALNYLEETVRDIEILPEDTITVDFSLSHGVFTVSIDSVDEFWNGEDTTSVGFSIGNEGENGIEWKVNTKLDSEEHVTEPWTLLASRNIGELLQDSAITAMLVRGHESIEYYFAGEGMWDGEDGIDRIYHVTSRDVTSYPQPNQGEGVIEDMAFGGGLVFVLRNNVYRFTDENSEFRYESPLENTKAIAWDNSRRINLIANDSGLLYGIDADGDVVDTMQIAWNSDWTLNSMEIYHDDKDDYNLYMNIQDLTSQNSPNQLYKASIETGDSMFVAFLDSTGSPVKGMHYRQYSQYSTAYIAVVDTVGGPLLKTWYFEDFTAWMQLSLKSGMIEANGSTDLELYLVATGLKQYMNDWPDRYPGKLIFHHSTPDLITEIPVLFGYGDSVEDDFSHSPSNFRIISAYPNPFNASLRVEYFLQNPTDVSLSLYSIDGRLIEIYTDGNKGAGVHTQYIDASHHPSGVYMLRLKSKTQSSALKAVLMK